MLIAGIEIADSYLWGMGGSICVELSAIVAAIVKHGGRCPPPYNMPAYIIARIGFTLVAPGILATALGAKDALTAFYLGASAPIVLDRVASGLRTPADAALPAAPEEADAHVQTPSSG